MKNRRILAIYEAAVEGVEGKELFRQLAKADWTVRTDKGVAIVSVEGAVGDYWAFSSGSYTSLRAKLETILEDESIKEIAILINSPGGDVLGLFECCDYIREAKASKPIHAHVTGMCCSAAYAIAAACTNITATETSQIGSIGILSMASDYTKYDEKMGILSKIFRSRNAQKKVESAFTEDGARSLQEKLDFYEDRFYDLISQSRGQDRQKCIDGYGHGGVFMAGDACERGMIDRVQSYGDFIGNLISSLHEREEEEEYMDISKMDAQERQELFRALVEAEPCLAEDIAAKATAKERERITSLLSNRTEASAQLIDAAVSDGRKVGEIAMELVALERRRNEELEKQAVNPMDQIASRAMAQQNVVPPAATAENLTDREKYEAAATEAARRVAELRNKEVANG